QTFGGVCWNEQSNLKGESQGSGTAKRVRKVSRIHSSGGPSPVPWERGADACRAQCKRPARWRTTKQSHKATASLLRRAAREARIGMLPTELTSLLPRRAERDDEAAMHANSRPRRARRRVHCKNIACRVQARTGEADRRPG